MNCYIITALISTAAATPVQIACQITIPAAGEGKLSTITCIWQRVMNSLWQEWYQ
jgi:hypothetical protein